MYLKVSSNAKIRLRSHVFVWVISAIASDNREVLSTPALFNLYILYGSISAPAMAENIPSANDCIAFRLNLTSRQRRCVARCLPVHNAVLIRWSLPTARHIQIQILQSSSLNRGTENGLTLYDSKHKRTHSTPHFRGDVSTSKCIA